jgi:lambda repressor-like predicted transcriptional regulator
MPRQSNKQAQTPLGYWLLDYVAKNQLTLTELSRLAGLSDGTLRSLIHYPNRKNAHCVTPALLELLKEAA